MSKTRTLLVGCGLALTASGVARAEDWPQFRGPTLQGISTSTGLPVALDEKAAAWSTPIDGKAWSSPVVADGKVWVTNATEDGKKLSLLRLAADTGKVEFDEVLFNIANPQFCHPFNSYASPSPVLEGDRLYVTFGSPGTACLDVKTGQKIWERTDFVCNHFRGSGASPSLWKDRLFLNFDGSDFQYVAALDKETGKTLWKTDRTVDYRDLDPATNKPRRDGDMRKGFSTPRVVEIDGLEQLVSVGGMAAYGYDPMTGKELWRLDFADLDNESHTPSGTPVFGHGLIFVSTGHGQGEFYAIKPAGGGNAGTGKLSTDAVVWRMKKNIPVRSSPVLVGDLLFMVDDAAMASCVEAKTGKELWKERIGGKGFSASPLLADGRVYFFGEDGTVTTVEPSPTFKKLGEGRFKNGFMATPAVADNAFYLRTKAAVAKVQK